MLRTGPRYRIEEKRDCVLIWNERDWSLPRRMVASFPGHPYDKGEALILAEICAAALNRELPGRVAGDPDPDLDVPPVAATRKPVAAPMVSDVELSSRREAGNFLPAPAEAPEAPAPAQPAPAAPPVPQPQTPLQAYAATRVAQRERKPMPDVSNLKGREKVQAMHASLFGEGT